LAGPGGEPTGPRAHEVLGARPLAVGAAALLTPDGPGRP
jgi:hypothetical protein